MSDEVIMLYHFWRRRYRNRRKYWVHPFIKCNLQHSANNVAKELQDKEHFQSFYRMTPETFGMLVELCSPLLEKKNTNWRLNILPDERILITLRYLATGSNFQALSFNFMRGRSTIGKIIEETTRAIWNALCATYMPVPYEDTWLRSSDRFWKLWNLPNCVAALDGKHIRVKCPKNSGSHYYNYKSFFSMVLMATCDADGIFLTIDVGEFGRNSDGGVFKNSSLGQLLNANFLRLPEPQPLPLDDSGYKIPFYFIADEAFPLNTNIMRPYARRTLDDDRRICNYRFSRGRKSIECAFGMLVSKFRVFEGPICALEGTVENIVKSACVLHNFIRKQDGIYSEPTYLAALSENVDHHAMRNLNNKHLVRDHLCQYFLKPEIALPHQWRYCVQRENENN